MVQHVHDQPCPVVDCGCLPAEFVRLRYFFGQRLGVVDFNDAQAYAVGKQRFHNDRLHGSGILCGLRAQRYPRAQGADPDESTTVLAVTRGAAIDACGREIVVPADQCIDVAAWFAANRERKEVEAWAQPSDEGNPGPLWVCLRYRDCPSDPTLAPRDPCGCNTAGCEYARIRESFELFILTPAERPEVVPASFPEPEQLRELLGAVTARAAKANPAQSVILQDLRTLLAQGCPLPSDDFCVCLASFNVTFNGEDRSSVVSIDEPDNCPECRRLLLSTGAIQALLLDLLTSGAVAGLPFAGPTFGELGLSDNADPPTIAVDVHLADDPATNEAAELVESTFDETCFKLARFGQSDSGGDAWLNVSQLPAELSVSNGEPTIELLADGLEAGRYRLSYAGSHSAPIVDRLMRPLRPSPTAWHFRLLEANGKLVLATGLFDGEGS